MNFYRNYKLYLLALFLLYGNLIISEDNREINTDEYNNLWSIGIELKEIYIDYSVYQIMISLLELNESAFENENINYLKKGYFLNLPEEKDLEKLEALSSVREVASQNLAANVGPIDFSVLVDVLVLSEPTFLLSEEDEDTSLIFAKTDLVGVDEPLIDLIEPEMALYENKDLTDFKENNVQIKPIDIPEFEIGSDNLSAIEKNFEKIPNRDFLNTEFYLLIGFILLLAFLFILRNRPAKNETKTLKKDEELKKDLDEEFGEIGDPIEARINLAITYIEMNQTDKANDLLTQVLESEATESQKEKARNLIKEI